MGKTVSKDGKAAMPAELDRAIEVFARGFGFTRSFAHPCDIDRVGPLWVVRDAPRKRGNYRNEEWIAQGTAPEEVDRIVREHTRGRFLVCAIHGTDEPDEPLRQGYKALGYRLDRTEPLMTHSLARVPRVSSPAQVERVTTQALAEALNKAARCRQVLPEHLADPSPLRQYVARLGDEIVGWVRSIVVGDATWCSDMYVKPEARRRGIARAMLCRVLRDDRKHGSAAAVLTASHTGAKLYDAVGYEQIGTVMVFTPRTR